MCAKYDTNLEKYKVLYTAYADEIRNLWQRSVFLGTFMVLVWTGYGALQLKAIERNSQNPYIYHCVSIGPCLVIIVLSLLWIAMAKGSKFVQEAHEEHIKNLNYDLLGETDIEIDKPKRLFCDLDFYQSKLENQLLFWNPLGTYRYSQSKINIALGWVSFIISFMLLNVHLFVIDEIKRRIERIVLYIVNSYYNEYVILIFIFTYSLIFVVLVTALIYLTLATQNQHKGGGKWNVINSIKAKLINWLKAIKFNKKERKMIDSGGAIIPFLDNSNFKVIYENDCFLIASGKVKGDDNSKISVGVRWRVSTMRDKPNLNGFPLTQNLAKCWLIIPNDLAICLLTNIKDREQSNICKIEKDKIYEVLQILIKQEQERVNRTKDSQ